MSSGLNALEALRELIAATDEYNGCMGANGTDDEVRAEVEQRTERYMRAWRDARALATAEAPRPDERSAFEAYMDANAPTYWRTTEHGRDAWRIWQAVRAASVPAQVLEALERLRVSVDPDGSVWIYIDGQAEVAGAAIPVPSKSGATALLHAERIRAALTAQPAASPKEPT
jgi:hypothetical protein